MSDNNTKFLETFNYYRNNPKEQETKGVPITILLCILSFSSLIVIFSGFNYEINKHIFLAAFISVLVFGMSAVFYHSNANSKLTDFKYSVYSGLLSDLFESLDHPVFINNKEKTITTVETHNGITGELALELYNLTQNSYVNEYYKNKKISEMAIKEINEKIT